jgi:hypothetical protein
MNATHLRDHRGYATANSAHFAPASGYSAMNPTSGQCNSVQRKHDTVMKNVSGTTARHTASRSIP